MFAYTTKNIKKNDTQNRYYEWLSSVSAYLERCLLLSQVNAYQFIRQLANDVHD